MHVTGGVRGAAEKSESSRSPGSPGVAQGGTSTNVATGWVMNDEQLQALRRKVRKDNRRDLLIGVAITGIVALVNLGVLIFVMVAKLT